MLWLLENAIERAFFNDAAAIHDRYATRQPAQKRGIVGNY